MNEGLVREQPARHGRAGPEPALNGSCLFGLFTAAWKDKTAHFKLQAMRSGLGRMCTLGKLLKPRVSSSASRPMKTNTLQTSLSAPVNTGISKGRSGVC